jgi:hypothetical protein
MTSSQDSTHESTARGVPFFTQTRRWPRGIPTLRDGRIELDLDKAENYWHPGADDQVALDLANIDSQGDIVSFVRNYGLLWTGPDAVPEETPDGALVFAEPMEKWFKARNSMLKLLRVGVALKGAAAGRPGKMAELRRLGETPKDSDSDEALLRHCSLFVQRSINSALRGVSTGIVDEGDFEGGGDRGTFRFIWDGPDLWTIAFHRAASLLVGTVDLEICQGCDSVFMPRDARQRYCGPSCSDRTRWRRWNENRQVQEA